MAVFSGISFISFLILITAIVDDLRTRKIHNHLILFIIPIALVCMAVFEGPKALLFMSLPSCLTALALSLPFYFLGMIGGGDLKLYFAVSLTWAVEEAFWSLVWAFPVGLAFGVLRLVFQGKTVIFLQNIWSLVQLKKVEKSQLGAFPFSIALLFGWLIFKTLVSL